MKWIFALLLVSAAGFGAWSWYEGRIDPVKYVQDALDSGQFSTLEIRYSAKQIMENERGELIQGGRNRYLEPELLFYPYLLMEVKFTSAKEKTKEGVLLWDLVTGEMVVDTSDWE